jgi:type VII secretion-associated serine protease mycosin
VTVDEGRIADVPRGATIGILGAPDELPARSRLVQTGWTACVSDATGVATTISRAPSTRPLAGGLLVSAGGADHLVTGGTQYPIDAGQRDAIVRLLGLAGETPLPVPATWLDLFAAGTALAPLDLLGAGDPAGAGLAVGDVVHQTGTAADDLLVVTSDGRLAALSPFARALYSLDHPQQPLEKSPSELAGVGNADAFGAADWPTAVPGPVSVAAPCAVLDTTHDSPAVALAAPRDGTTPAAGGRVDASAGALVRAVGTGAPTAGQIALVDASGTAYPVPDATTDADVLARLGYAAAAPVSVPQPWVALLPAGPSLTEAAAASAPVIAPDTDPGLAPGGQGDVSVDGVAADADDACTAENAALAPGTPAALGMLQAGLTAPLATGAGRIVAVVDSGVDATNPHLRGVVLPGLDLVERGGDGREDAYGHGTAIAGLIAAQRVDGSGVVGLAPGARILPVRVFRSLDDADVTAGDGPRADRIAQGIVWAAEHGATIVNVSLSTTEDSPALRQAVATAVAHGALVVASAGNVTTASAGETDGERYPAGYPGALGVTAVDPSGVVADSFHGPQVAVAAPGEAVVTSAARGLDCTYSPSSASASFATAFASAAAALVAERFPQSGPATWAYRLEATASRPSPERRDDTRGWGLIQPYDALTAVLDGTTPGPENPDAARVGPAPAPAVAVRTDAVTAPLAGTQRIAAWLGVGGAAVLVPLALLARVRRGALRRP